MIENEIESKIENTVFDDLVNEMVDNRKKLSEILDKVTSFRNNIERLIPNSNEYKNRFIMEQKIKTVTEIIKSELEIRKQIDSSIKTEFDLRSKIRDKDNMDNDNFDLHGLMPLLESKLSNFDESELDEDKDGLEDEVDIEDDEKFKNTETQSDETQQTYENIVSIHNKE